MTRAAHVYVSFREGLQYRGGQTMIAWLLHRLTGIGIVLFVSMHVIAAFLLNSVQGATGSVANALTRAYESLPMQLFILFSVLFHALNGLRIIILDMWPSLHPRHLQALRVQWIVFAVAFLVPAALMIVKAVS